MEDGDAEALERLRGESDYGTSNPFRALRAAFDINQDKASKRCGVSRTLWLAWEGKRRPINVDQLERVVTSFGLQQAELRWIVQWWGTDRGAPLTVAQLNLFNQALPAPGLDVVALLARRYGLQPS